MIISFNFRLWIISTMCISLMIKCFHFMICWRGWWYKDSIWVSMSRLWIHLLPRQLSKAVLMFGQRSRIFLYKSRKLLLIVLLFKILLLYLFNIFMIKLDWWFWPRFINDLILFLGGWVLYIIRVYTTTLLIH